MRGLSSCGISDFGGAEQRLSVCRAATAGCHVARAAALVGGGELLGPLLEGLVVSELRKQQTWSDTRYSVFHYRETSGVEVDILLELDDGRVLGLEVKAKQTYKPEHFRGLQRLAERLGDRFLGGVVLGTADQRCGSARTSSGCPSHLCGTSDRVTRRSGVARGARQSWTTASTSRRTRSRCTWPSAAGDQVLTNAPRPCRRHVRGGSTSSSCQSMKGPARRFPFAGIVRIR
ncbi:DUF4143 domain-containing protein [Myceligenerans pegani]